MHSPTRPVTATVARPFWVPLGSLILFTVFIALLAGRFTLGRFGESLPDTDLRLILMYLVITGALVWMLGAHPNLPKRVRVPGAVAFTLWVTWMALSAAWAPQGARTAEAVIDLGLLFVFVMVGWAVAGWLPAEATAKIWTWVFVAGLIYFLGAMYAGPGEQGRYSAFGGGPNVFVRIMVLGALAALYLSIAKKKTWPLLTVPLFAVGAALSGSRGGLLAALVIAFVFLIPVARNLGGKKVAAILVLAGFGLIGAASWNGGMIFQFVQQRYIQQTLVEGYTSGRSTITDQAVNLFQQNPIAGVGLDGYYALQDTPGGFEYPHNLFLATAAEGGVVGAIFLVLAVLIFVIGTLRRKPVPPTAFIGCVAGIYLAVASLFSGDYYDSRLMWFFFGLAAIEAARSRLPVKEAPTVVPATVASRSRTLRRY